MKNGVLVLYCGECNKVIFKGKPEALNQTYPKQCDCKEKK